MNTEDPDLLARVSVWSTGQKQARTQRQGRYTPASTDHPAKMLPAIARHAITTYTDPGDTVLDPMCGIGTTLVEALDLDRDAVGIELSAQWADLARVNLDHAADRGATGTGAVHTGDARHTAAHLAARPTPVRAALLLTSPPYGAMTHGKVRTRRDGAPAHKVEKWSHRYSPDRDAAQLAHQRPAHLLESFTAILTACRPLLRPGAHVVITTRPYRKKGVLVDFPAHVATAAERAGLELVDRCAALLCALTAEGTTVSRASFFQMVETQRLRDRGLPAHVIAHEDVLVLTHPGHDTGEGRQP